MPGIYSDAQLSSHVDTIFERLRAIEAHLTILSEKAGVPYDNPSASAPPEVMEKIAAGDRMGAIRAYREATGAGLEEAQAAIAKL